jgi:hypothetical protein
MPKQSLLDPAPQIGRIGRDVRTHRPAQEMLARLAGQEGQPPDRGVADVAVNVRQTGADRLARKALRRRPKAAGGAAQGSGGAAAGMAAEGMRHNQLENSSSGSRLGRWDHSVASGGSASGSTAKPASSAGPV